MFKVRNSELDLTEGYSFEIGYFQISYSLRNSGQRIQTTWYYIETEKHGIESFSQMNVKLSSGMLTSTQRTKTSRKQSLRIKQNIYSLYSPNRFYFTFQHDDSWNFDKILNAVRKNNIYYFIKYMVFLFFGWL